MNRTIIKKPLISEKTNTASEKLGRYSFVVDKDANKIEIKNSIEKMYNVNVDKVWTQNYIGKIKTRNTRKGPVTGLVNRYKKATVSLAQGEVIDFYSNI